jgi:WS/DGAT/MGAT family acyltransferase
MTSRSGDGPRVSLPLSSAPPTPWNKSITAHRRFAMRNSKLSDLKRIKAETGGTLNDIVMAICAGALRNYLIEHDALPDRPLRAMVPVSIRTGDETEPWTNRVSGLVVDLPTNLGLPLERVGACREAMDRAKRQFELVPAEALVDIQQYSSPVVATAATRLASRLKLADRIDAPVNVIISNVPGPRQPLYMQGSRMRTYIPVSTIAEGMGLNITVHSYLDELEFGLIACRELVPDLWHMIDLHVAEIDVLADAAGVNRPATAPTPIKRATKRATAKRATAKKAAAKKAAPRKRTVKKAAARSA